MNSDSQWKGEVFAVIPTPVSENGGLERESLRHLVARLRTPAIRGVSIGATVGRQSPLSPKGWSSLVATCREGMAPGQILVATVGAAPEIRRPHEVFEAALALARSAASAGADALIVKPPSSVRGRPERDRLVLEYHANLAEAGLPILVSYRRESLGGIAYGPEVLAQLLARAEILGVEIATLDGIATFQQVEALTRELAPGKLVISGEERFLGYSLMCGADAAIVGIAAAYPEIVADLLEAHGSGDASRFLKRSAEVDALARPIFRAPFDGSTARLLRALADQGMLPTEVINEPPGP